MPAKPPLLTASTALYHPSTLLSALAKMKAARSSAAAAAAAATSSSCARSTDALDTVLGDGGQQCGALWVFAYGSLMWQVPDGVEVLRRVRARLPGFAREFCVPSRNYRGTPEAPGLCLGLRAAARANNAEGDTDKDVRPAAWCDGVALYLGDASCARARRSLQCIDAQEMIPAGNTIDVYLRRAVTVDLLVPPPLIPSFAATSAAAAASSSSTNTAVATDTDNGEPSGSASGSASARALAYVVNEASATPRPMCLRQARQALREQAGVIARASGARGTNLEYLAATARRLEGMGIEDRTVIDLLRQIESGTVHDGAPETEEAEELREVPQVVRGGEGKEGKEGACV